MQGKRGFTGRPGMESQAREMRHLERCLEYVANHPRHVVFARADSTSANRELLVQLRISGPPCRARPSPDATVKHALVRLDSMDSPDQLLHLRGDLAALSLMCLFLSFAGAPETKCKSGHTAHALRRTIDELSNAAISVSAWTYGNALECAPGSPGDYEGERLAIF